MISVIVPVYNVEAYLNDCLESIVNQTYSDLEIILVDDGSTDSSGLMCDEWAEKDKRIRVFHIENGGAANARNKGLDECSGDYILFCDSDDYYDKNAVQLLYDVLIRNDADVAVANLQRVSINKEKLDIAGGKIFDRAGVFNEKEVWDNVSKDRWGTILLIGRLFRRGVWKNVRFPKIRAYEDEAVFHLLMERTKKMAFIEDALYFYRQTDGSIMRSTGNYVRRLLLPNVLLPRITYLFSEKMYDNAVYNYFKGIWVIAEASSKQHLHDPETKKRVQEMKDEYKKVSKEIRGHLRTIKDIVKYILSKMSLRLYVKVCLKT